MVMALVESRPGVAGALLLVSIAGPYAVTLGHLTLARELSPVEKRHWLPELAWGHRSIVAVWTYLLTGDLHSASRELAEKPRAWWRP
jgi:hypothetical protein